MDRVKQPAFLNIYNDQGRELLNGRFKVSDGRKDFHQLTFLDVHNVKGMVLNQALFEKVVNEKGNLSGAILAPDVKVEGMTFQWVKMDKDMLVSLKKRGANLQAVDLSKQNFTGVDLSDFDLSYANLTGANLSFTNCTGTNFKGAILQETSLFGATLDKTNLIGVDLSTASLAGVEVLFVIVDDNDRRPYIEQAVNRLLFVLTRKPVKEYENDQFNQLPPEKIAQIHRLIQFVLTNKSFDEGKTSEDKGPQDIVRDGKLEGRITNSFIRHTNFELEELSASEITKRENFVVERVLKAGFTHNQKILLHRFRSATDAILKINGFMWDHGLIDQTDYLKNSTLEQIYLQSGKCGPRLTHQLGEKCFDLILEYSPEQLKKIMTPEEIQSTKDLALSPDYCWT